MLNGLSWVRNRNPLRSLNSRNLEGQEEFGDFDGQAAADGTDAGFSGEIGIEGVFEDREVVGGERGGGAEFREGEVEGGEIGFVVGDGGEGDAV